MSEGREGRRDLSVVPVGRDALKRTRREKSPFTIKAPVALRTGLAASVIGASVAGIIKVEGFKGTLSPLTTTVRQAKDFLQELNQRVLDPESAEQKAAREKWEQLQKEGKTTGMVFDLVVGRNGAILRNMPRVVPPRENPDSFSRELGRLKPDDLIPTALIWQGESPEIPGKKDTWFAIKLENGRVVFSWSGNFLKWRRAD